MKLVMSLFSLLSSYLLDIPYAVEVYLQEKSHPSDRAEDHFDLNSKIGAMHRARYLNDGYFETLELLKEVAVSTCPDLARKFCPMLTHAEQTFPAPDRDRSPLDPASLYPPTHRRHHHRYI